MIKNCAQLLKSHFVQRFHQQLLADVLTVVLGVVESCVNCSLCCMENISLFLSLHAMQLNIWSQSVWECPTRMKLTIIYV